MKNQILPGLKILFLIHFVLGLIFGLAYLLIPQAFGALLAWPITEPTPWRLLGAAILGFSFGSWWAYKAATWDQVRIVVMTELVWPTLGALALLGALLFERLPAAGWLDFVILAGLAIAFYIFYSRQEASPMPVVSAPVTKPAVKAVRKAARPARKRARR